MNKSPLDKKSSWEDECKIRIQDWHDKLANLKMKGDEETIKTLQTAINIQVSLSDLKIKARQADHPKQLIWGPILLPFASAILGALIALAGSWWKHS